MTKPQSPSSQPPEETEESARFGRMRRALPQVDRREKPKGEPKR
jgi:hypothetical protein